MIDPDTIRLQTSSGAELEVPSAARDQIAAWMADPAGPESISVDFWGWPLVLTRGG